MNFEEFKASLSGNTPPEGISRYLLALWYDGRKEWEKSHDIAQEIFDSNGSWIHGYLHRKEGDLPNAGYWYRKAKKQQPYGSLDKEWEDIVKAFL
jgi:hypothetical protein